MSLIERLHGIRDLHNKLVNPPNAVPDYGIDLKRPKDWTPPHLVEASQIATANEHLAVPIPTNEFGLDPGVHDIVGEVAKHLQTSIQSILFNASDLKARDGRLISIGLVVYRLGMLKDNAAKAFNVLPEVVDDAEILVKDVLISAAVPLGISLNEMTLMICQSFSMQRHIMIKNIKIAVCAHFKMSMHDLLSSRRTMEIVWPRQIGMYLAKILTMRSLPEIGREFGNRDHTTVLHAVRKIEGWRPNDAALDAELNELEI